VALTERGSPEFAWAVAIDATDTEERIKPAGASGRTLLNMRRISSLFVAVVWLASASGCGGLGLYRAAGHLPGVATTDYAFYNFCDVASQLYPASPPQIESSAIEALGDLGFKLEGPPAHAPSGESTMIAKTQDGRPTKITISPQNSLTNVKVAIGPVHIGDQELSRDLLRRIALNFGTVMRAYTPVDTIVPRRINASQFAAQTARPGTSELEGEGLRPNEKRDKASGDESVPPDQEALPTPSLPPGVQGLMQGAGYQINPNLQYLPFPIPANTPDLP
jgi:hypothetical protein